jgi:hypothetical protein
MNKNAVDAKKSKMAAPFSQIGELSIYFLLLVYYKKSYPGRKEEKN